MLRQRPALDAHPGDVIEGSAELEKFVLAACQMSVHFALQFFWIVYASLQEHCPKKAGSKRGIYTRHAPAPATVTATSTNHARPEAPRQRQCQRSALPAHPLQPWAPRAPGARVCCCGSSSVWPMA